MGNNGVPRPPTHARTVEIRLSLSTFALRTLSEPRVRRLVEIETEDVAVLAPGAIGPLGDHVAHVWIDQPTISKVVVEVRVGDHNVERREIAVRGLAADVTARLVAIAISEMVRTGMAPRPAPPPPPAAPPKPTPDEIERASRSAAVVQISPEVTFAALPGASAVLAGPGLALGFRRFGLSAGLFGRWLAGDTPRGALRWLEIGLGVDYRLWLHRSWRLAFGGSAALASLHVSQALAVAGEAGREALSARAGGLFAVEAKIAEGAWLSLSAEPSAILRATRFTTATGDGVVKGAWLGAGLSVRFER